MTTLECHRGHQLSFVTGEDWIVNFVKTEMGFGQLQGQGNLSRTCISKLLFPLLTVKNDEF